MHESLIVYQGIMKPVVFEMLMNLETMFTKIEYTEHELGVKEIEYLGTALTDQDKALTVEAVYEQHIDHTLLVLGITLVDDDDRINLTFKGNLLIQLLSLTSPEYFDILEANLETGKNNDIESLYDILTEMSDETFTFYESRIEAVSDNFMNRLKDLVPSPEFSQYNSELTATIVSKLKKLNLKENSVIYGMVVETSQLPLEKESTFSRVIAGLAGLKPLEAATEAYGAIIATNTDEDSAKQDMYDILSAGIDDIDLLYKAIDEIDNLGTDNE